MTSSRFAIDAVGRLVSVQPANTIELIDEPRLAGSFKLSLPLPGMLNHYLDATTQTVEVVRLPDGVDIRLVAPETPVGQLDLEATFSIRDRADGIVFSSTIRNNTQYPLAEVWFPMIGGLHGVREREDTELCVPGVSGVVRPRAFTGFDGSFGNEYPFMTLNYPGPHASGMVANAHVLSMPWLTLTDTRVLDAVWLAELNPIQRTFSFHLQHVPGAHGSSSADNWPTPEELDGRPIGVIVSKVSYPHTAHGEFVSGECLLAHHEGDWHQSALLYREWFLERFPFRHTSSWLRREQAWFSAIVHQPEDRVVATLDEFASWSDDAADTGIDVCELIGWDKGGLERDYPEYVPDDRVGGWDGYRRLIEHTRKRGTRLLTFANYQILDSCTDWYRDELERYRQMDSFGQTENWMAWGESTLKAANGLDVRRHVPASVAVPGFRELLDRYLLRLVEEGTDGIQLDKVLVSGHLDFNPAHARDADLPMCEDLVQAIADLYERAVEINSEFRLASEAGCDRYVPFVDVFYRAATREDISPLRYTFPEWTSCIHVSSPFDRTSVNAALLFGAVLVVEPFNYTRSIAHPEFAAAREYIRVCVELRRELIDFIFDADYLDQIGAALVADRDGLRYRVHARRADGKRAVVVVNDAREAATYRLAFDGGASEIRTHRPGSAEPTVARAGAELAIEGESLHVHVEI